MDTTGIAIVLVAPGSALVATDVEILGFWLLPHAHAQSRDLEWHAGNRGVARGIRPAGDIGLQGPTPIRGYKLAGGPTNPNLMKEGTTLYEKEGKRVVEWATKQSEAQPRST